MCCDTIFFKSPDVVTSLLLHSLLVTDQSLDLFLPRALTLSSQGVSSTPYLAADLFLFPHPILWRFSFQHPASHSSLALLKHLQHCHLVVFWQVQPWEHKHHREVNTLSCMTQSGKKTQELIDQSFQYGIPWALSSAKAYNIPSTS